jgi:hypothetical protein
MKLPKTLLAAIVVGIAAQTIVSSCSKDNTPPPKKPTTQESKSDPANPWDNCPACGMG